MIDKTDVYKMRSYVKLIAECISSTHIKLYDKNPRKHKDAAEIKDHPFFKVLNKKSTIYQKTLTSY